MATEHPLTPDQVIIAGERAGDPSEHEYIKETALRHHRLIDLVSGLDKRGRRGHHRTHAHRRTVRHRRRRGDPPAGRRPTPLTHEPSSPTHRPAPVPPRDGLPLRVANVSSVEPGAVMSVVKVTLEGGQQVVSSITRDAAEDLGLVEGKPVTVLVKSTEVMLAVD